MLKSRITDKQISEIAKNNGIEYAMLKAFIEVESGGIGFAKDTGKIIIQFEPAWFRRKEPFAPSGLWSVNKVERQSKEWLAFNNAFAIDADSAMQSTSIGMGQIMGFHFKTLGYKTVGEMWDDAKSGEYQQVLQMVRFIRADVRLYNAMRLKRFSLIATYYNGAGFRELAKKIGREPYDISLEKAYNKFSKL